MHVVEMRAIYKRFGDVVANNQIDFQLNKGEIHALLGENGAGKTTLMRILYGLYHADQGEIFINQEKVDPRLLKRRLEQTSAAKFNKEVLLRADRGVPYGVVVQAMADIKNAGIEKLGMVTEPLETRK